MFVSSENLEALTGKRRPSAQERFLRLRFPTMLLTIRDDGSIALRQEELDRWTLTKPAEVKRSSALDLSYLDNEPTLMP